MGDPGVGMDPTRRVAADEVLGVASGVQAQKVLETDSDFDFPLRDLMMPERPGVDFHPWCACGKRGVGGDPRGLGHS